MNALSISGVDARLCVVASANKEGEKNWEKEKKRTTLPLLPLTDVIF
jgi:hypothetical protein